MSDNPFDDSSGFVDLTRLKDGRVMCCICFAYRTPQELFVKDGERWDLCGDGDCAREAGVR